VRYSVLDDHINPLSGDMLCVENAETITRPSLDLTSHSTVPAASVACGSVASRDCAS
jgi:hypothetical protein